MNQNYNYLAELEAKHGSGAPPLASASSLIGEDSTDIDSVVKGMYGPEKTDDPEAGIPLINLSTDTAAKTDTPPIEIIDDTKWRYLKFPSTGLREDECLETLKNFLQENFEPGEFKKLRDSNKELAQDIYLKSFRVLCPPSRTAIAVQNAVEAWKLLDFGLYFQYFEEWKDYLEKRQLQPERKGGITRVRFPS